jgi:hypothetical protein
MTAPNLPVTQDGYHNRSQFAGNTRWKDGCHYRSQFAGNTRRDIMNRAHNLPATHEGYHEPHTICL